MRLVVGDTNLKGHLFLKPFINLGNSYPPPGYQSENGVPMKNENSILIMMLTTLVLLFGDLLYRSTVKPRNIDDLLVVIGGITICTLIVFPQSAKNAASLRKGVGGGVIGAVLGTAGVALRDYLTKGSLNWSSYLSTDLGFAIAFTLILVVAHFAGWRES